MQIGIMEATPKTLRGDAAWEMLAVDKKAKVIKGYVVAQKGPFKSKGRGEFDMESLRSVVRLMRQNTLGTKAHLGHATLSDDGVGKILGRAKNPRLEGDKVRADLHFSEAAFHTPQGDIATYVMKMADEDPGLLSSSLVLEATDEPRLDKKGEPLTDKDGEPLPPLWRPTKIHASDIVDTGDAVDDLLSTDELPDALQRQGARMLNTMFPNQPREVVQARLLAWTNKYLDMRYPPVPKTVTTAGDIDDYRAIVAKQMETVTTR